ncbi:RraA family protein [Brachybacterium sp. p3-SID1565]|uniref:Putative 4-hydroxy-4-methyl-2-oxoglutarate aldolase n=1 Tax=Brachybacterium epidermidis TaxID=2781983 RepID=A0ABR9W2A6_9MICO|nr:MULTISPECIES: RraA family protein [Brachybacterium]MBE9404283.1 RraA family protein [Brachybacterium epidermidis]MCT1384392.1 RraA family protein [Brachybacterium sp. p3-SID1565]
MFIAADASTIDMSAPWERLPDEQVQRLADIPVALIGDTRRRLGMMAAALRPVTRQRRIVGSVLPVLTWEGDNLAIHAALDAARPGDVLVINANAEINRSVFGDILAEICLHKGVTGVVIDGAVRDVDTIDQLGLPVFARGISPAGPAKHGPGAVGYPVACGNVVCNPGDIVVGDTDGVIVLPARSLDTVLEAVDAQEATEEAIRARIRQDAPRERPAGIAAG